MNYLLYLILIKPDYDTVKNTVPLNSGLVLLDLSFSVKSLVDWCIEFPSSINGF